MGFLFSRPRVYELAHDERMEEDDLLDEAMEMTIPDINPDLVQFQAETSTDYQGYLRLKNRESVPSRKKPRRKSATVLSALSLWEHVDGYLHTIIDKQPVDHMRCVGLQSSTLQMHAASWAFVHCLGIPALLFDMRVHTIEDWIKLSGPTIRAAIELCPNRRGFVLVFWIYPKGPSRIGRHVTLFNFDAVRRHQVFFDPSHACNARVPTQSGDLVTLFRSRHLWDPEGTCEIVDADVCHKSRIALQEYFEPPRLGMEGGSCVTVCLLFVVCCLRFRCSDMQRMCDALRATMVHRNYLNTDRQEDFVKRIYAWHETLNPKPETEGKSTNGWNNREYLLEACGVRLTESLYPCGVILDDRTGRECCRRKPCLGWAMCTKHLQEQFGVALCQQTHPVLDEHWKEPQVPIDIQFPAILSTHTARKNTSAPTEASLGTVLYIHKACQRLKVCRSGSEPIVDGGSGRYTVLRLDGYLDRKKPKGKRLGRQLARTAWDAIQKQNPRIVLQIHVPHSYEAYQKLPGGAFQWEAPPAETKYVFSR